MCRNGRTMCVKDSMTIARQNAGDKCGCCRGVCPRMCPASDDCNGGKGSSMCLEQSNDGKVTICVNKPAVQTKLDNGIGTCGRC
mmetsp:Transcript_1092/g.1905  ORF Transcript_1092/g.1905 Transcript_1092/m.1905 type:complete len:84 (+) Transcript_1092:1-252(+)